MADNNKFFVTNVIEIATSIDNLGRKDDNPYEGERDNPSLRYFKGAKSYDVLKMHREDLAVLIYCTDWKQLILWADNSCHEYAVSACVSEGVDYSTIDVGDGNFVLFAPRTARLEEKLAEHDYFVDYNNENKEEADEADSETDEDEAKEAEADEADSEAVEAEAEAEESESNEADEAEVEESESNEAVEAELELEPESETEEEEEEEEEEEFEAVTVTDQEGNEILSLECESGATEQCVEQALANSVNSIFSGLEVADRHQDCPKVSISDELSEALANAEAAAEAAKNLAESSEPAESEIELKGVGEGFKLPPVAAKSEETEDTDESEFSFGEGFFQSGLGHSHVDIGDLSEFE